MSIEARELSVWTPQTSPESNQSLKPRSFWETPVTRRGFLKAAAATGASLVIGSPRQAEAADKASVNGSFPKSGTIYDDLRGKEERLDWSLLESGGQGMLLGVANAFLGRYLRRRGLPIGNLPRPEEQSEELRELMNSSPLQAVSSWIAAPLIEEMAFRNYPKRRWANGGDMRWDIGAVSSLAFTLFHNITGTVTPPRISFSFKRLHALAFPIGLFFWWKVKTEGYYHAAATHAGHNLGTFGVKLIKRD